MMILVYVHCLWLHVFNMSVYLVLLLFSISHSDMHITVLSIFLDIFVKLNDIMTDLLIIVHYPVCLTIVLSVVWCNVFVWHVICIVSIMSIFGSSLWVCVWLVCVCLSNCLRIFSGWSGVIFLSN